MKIFNINLIIFILKDNGKRMLIKIKKKALKNINEKKIKGKLCILNVFIIFVLARKFSLILKF